MSDYLNCKNCGQLLSEKFCSHCGQKSKVDRITFQYLAQQLSESVLQINKGFLFTVKELTLRPGHSIREYLEGKRVNHFKPIPYVLLLSTVYFLVSKTTGQNTWINDGMEGFYGGALDADADAKLPYFLKWCSDNYPYLTLIILPIFSIATYIAFIKSGRNIYEHVVVNSYVTGHQAIIYSLFAFVFTNQLPDVLSGLPLLASIVYCFFVFWQFFNHNKRLINVLSSLLSYIIYLFFFIIVFFLALGIDFSLK